MDQSLVLHLDAAKASGSGPYSSCDQSSNWSDLSSKKNDTTVTNASSCSTGVSGWAGTGVPTDPYAFTFDGVDDLIVKSSGTGMPLGSKARTQLAWFLRYSGAVPNNVGGLIFQGTPADNQGFSIGISNALTFYISAYGNDVQSAETVSNNQWVHVAATYDGTGNFNTDSVRGYINGSLSTLSDAYHMGGAVNTVGENFALGAPEGTTGYFFKGKIAILKMYDKALSADEVLAECKADVARFNGASCSQ